MRAQLELSAGCLVLIEHRLDGRLCVRLDAGYRMVADRRTCFSYEPTSPHLEVRSDG